MSKTIVGVGALIEKSDKVLIVQRSRSDRYNKCAWELPGGKIEFGESIIDALRREVKEEVNLEIDVLFPLTVSSRLRYNKHVIVIIFLCSYKSGWVKLSNEHSSFKWVNPEEILKIEKTSPFLDDAIHSYLDFINGKRRENNI